MAYNTVWPDYDGTSTERNSNDLMRIFHFRFHHNLVILYALAVVIHQKRRVTEWFCIKIHLWGTLFRGTRCWTDVATGMSVFAIISNFYSNYSESSIKKLFRDILSNDMVGVERFLQKMIQHVDLGKIRRQTDCTLRFTVTTPCLTGSGLS